MIINIGKSVRGPINRNAYLLSDEITDTTWDSVNETLRVIVTNNISGEIGNLIWQLVSRRVNNYEYEVRRSDKRKSNW
jgi:hypothetical protein